MMQIQGRAHLLPEEINTDVHCSTKYMPGRDAAYIAQHAFERIAPGFVKRFERGDVIVAGRNFGINSSREQAVHVMRLIGVAAIVAPAFGRQFFRNAINNGLPVVECAIAGIEEADAIEIDLAAGRLSVPGRGFERTFAPLPGEIQTLLEAGGLIPFLQRHSDWGISRRS
ncbi:MAG: LeuD/DmdB family oxidoreductase small subunit [Burkholderiales bacterium]